MTKTFDIEARETRFDGFYRIDRLTLRSTGIEESYTREVFLRGHSACVLVFDPVHDLVLFVEELRVGNIAAGLDPEQCWVLGPIAGMVDPGETAMQTVQREAIEEAGISLAGHTFFGPRTTLPSPGGSSEVIHHYIALADLSGVEDGTTYGMAGEAESTTVRVLTREDAEARIFGGISNGLAATCMSWLETLVLSGRLPIGEAAAA